MDTLPTISEIATSLREAQPQVEVNLNDRFGSSPEKVRAEKLAYELRCLVFETLSSSENFMHKGAYSEPAVLVVHEDDSRIKESSYEGPLPLLSLMFPASDAMAQDIVSALEQLKERGVTERQAIPGELGEDSEKLPGFEKRFSFGGMPILYTPTTPV